MRDVKGKTVLITGGAMGMGKLWAKHFLEDGSKVILWDIKGDILSSTVQELDKDYPSMVTGDTIDISDKNAIFASAKKIEANAGGIDVLVNNAGIVKGGEFVKSDENDLSRMIDINLKSVMLMMRAFMPGMLTKKEAHIVNISSAAGLIGMPYTVSYAASKWGVIGLTESVKAEMKELGYKNIHFTLLCPGYINTGMFDGVKSPLLMHILDPDKLINKSYMKFKKNKYLILEPMLVKITPLLKGILPNSFFNFISKLLGITGSMQRWKGH
jgi:all-trans-retinol dehydrogenase (NAD+)